MTGLEQASPDVILTNWKADDMFIDVLRDYGTPNFRFSLVLLKDCLYDVIELHYGRADRAYS